MGEARRKRLWRFQGYDPRKHHLPGGGRCLNCGERLDGAIALHGRNPRAGDRSVCGLCGHVMIFADDGGGLRAPTDAEMVAMAGAKDLLLAQDVRMERERIKKEPSR